MTPTRHHTSTSAVDHALTRASRDDYHTWIRHVHTAAGCANPIRLAGELLTIETGTGRLLEHTPTANMPDGVIYTPCGNRRASACPTCAETYRRDAYHLIRAGLAGGKTIPDTVTSHPAVFITLTAPSFGPVHTRRTTPDGRQLPCRPRRTPNPCPHGIHQRCHRHHTDDDPTLGTPICPDCYQHEHQAVWNHHAGELWRRTRIATDRHLTRLTTTLGTAPVRLRYAKVAEFQHRGVVHFHILARLDGHHPDLPGLLLPPPDTLTVEHLHQAVTTAAAATTFTTQPHPQQPAGWTIAWGQQIDIRPVRATGTTELNDQAAAGYLAKYATKSTETTGHISRPLTPDTIDLYANPTGTHAERLIHACWQLGGAPGWGKLRRWAHMLGYGGHFLTKARHWSTTFKALRQTRTNWRRQQRHPDHNPDTTTALAWLTYVASGWKTPGDALLANTAAAHAREQAEAAKDALSGHRCEMELV